MSMLRKELLFSVVLVVILASSVFIAPTVLLSHDTDLGVSEDFEVDEEVIEEQVEVALRCQFYENLGQVDNPDIIFYGNIPGGMIGFAESRVLLWMEGANGVVTLYFENSQHVVPVGVDEMSPQTNYLLGNRGAYSHIRGFSSIIYENLWPGIDLVYQATKEGAKYEFQVISGAELADIRIRCEGQDSIAIRESSLRIEKGRGTFVDDGLRMFQGAVNIEGEFTLFDGGVFGFKVGDYDRSKLLVIDPLVYSTYVGGSGNEEYIWDIALDDSGNVYVTGRTFSTDFPTVNAYNTTGDGSTTYTDVFVFKLSSNGSSLLYSTYVGGSMYDSSYGIEVDSSGNVYVTGNTASTDFPTVNAYDATIDGYSDVFVFKLAANGSSLHYSTYVGGSSDDISNGIALDNTGNVYVTGDTHSDNFPMVNAYDATLGGINDAFVFKLAANGSSLLYSTYVGGSNYEWGRAITVDSTWNVYVTGFTWSSDFPTVNAYDATGYTTDGNDDVFVFKLAANGSSLLYSTYVGGNGGDFGEGITVDSAGNAYVTGVTESTNFPTVNAYDSTHDGVYMSFVFKLATNGSSMFYSTYVEEGGEGRRIAVDSMGNAYVIGDLENNVSIFKLSSDGSSILYSTYVGGSNYDEGRGIAVDDAGNVYVAGTTYSTDFPTVNAYNATGDGSTSYADVFVFKFIEDKTNPDLDSPSDLRYEQGTIGNEIVWTVGDLTPNLYMVDGNGSTVDWTAWSNGSIVVDVDGYTPGVYNYTVIVGDEWGNEAVDTVFVTVEDTTSPDLDSLDDFIYEAGSTGNQINWTAGDFNPSQYRVVGNGTLVSWTDWSSGPILVNVDGHAPGIYNYTIIVRDDYDNQAIDTVFVTVEDSTPPDLDSPDDLSYEQGTTGNEIVWTVNDLYPGQYRIDGNGTTVDWTDWSSSPISFNIDGLTLGVYNYTITVRDDYGNEAMDTVFVTVVDLTGPEISNIQQSPTTPRDDTDVSITTTVSDAISSVTSVKLYYRTRPEGGVWSDLVHVIMGLQTGDTYRGTIPVQDYMTLVEYYIWAEDSESNSANTSSSPYEYIVLSSDFTGPSIELSHSPEPTTEQDYVVVTALVTDDSGVAQVTLQYSIDASVTWTNVTMDQSGVQWSGAIPQQAVDVTVHFRVLASDNIGNSATATDSYVVVSSLDIGSIAILAGEALAGIGAIVAGIMGFRRWRVGRAAKEAGALEE